MLDYKTIRQVRGADKKKLSQPLEMVGGKSTRQLSFLSIKKNIYTGHEL